MQEEINLLLDDPPYEEWRHRYRTWVLDGLIQFLKGKKGDAKDSEGENVEPVTKEDAVKISMMQANNDAKVVCISDISTISLVPE